MLRVFSPERRSTGLRKAALVPAMGAALALGACSTDFMRFDSPAFNLNGDTSDIGQTSADTTTDPASYEQRVASAPAASTAGGAQSYAPAPVAKVRRGAPETTTDRYTPKRVARSEPISGPAKPGNRGSTGNNTYAPVTTGALPAQNSIVVQPGDTLYQLSRRHGVTVTALRQANGLTGNVIRPGQRLLLPGRDAGQRQYAATPNRQTPRYQPRPQYRAPAPAARQPSTNYAGSNGYVVRPGDSLYAISRRTGVSVAELKRRNGITNVRAIRPGLRLSLGGGSSAAERPVVSQPSTRVASRSEIRAKTIKTMPIVREKSTTTTTTSTSAPSAYQPRILNQRPDRPIATKPEQKVAMVPPANTAQKFRWPARGRVIAAFNHSGRGTKNDGIKIALPLGTAVEAAGDGVVAYAGSELKGYGNLVLVRHDNGWVSAYAHASEVLVKRGDRVSRGQTIARAGRTGGVSQPQLHFELRKGVKPVDPMPHLEQL